MQSTGKEAGITSPPATSSLPPPPGQPKTSDMVVQLWLYTLTGGQNNIKTPFFHDADCSLWHPAAPHHQSLLPWSSLPRLRELALLHVPASSLRDLFAFSVLHEQVRE